MYDASSDARNANTAAISSDSAARFIGICDSTLARALGSSVHADHAVEVGAGKFMAGRRLLDSGIVDQDVDPAKGCKRLGEHALHIFVRCDIRLNYQLASGGAFACSLRHGARLFRLVGAAVV